MYSVKNGTRSARVNSAYTGTVAPSFAASSPRRARSNRPKVAGFVPAPNSVSRSTHTSAARGACGAPPRTDRRRAGARRPTNAAQLAGSVRMAPAASSRTVPPAYQTFRLRVGVTAPSCWTLPASSSASTPEFATTLLFALPGNPITTTTGAAARLPPASLAEASFASAASSRSDISPSADVASPDGAESARGPARRNQRNAPAAAQPSTANPPRRIHRLEPLNRIQEPRNHDTTR